MQFASSSATPVQPRQPARPPAGPALDEDGLLADEVDLAFSTPLTVVVPARVEFSSGAAAQDVQLVIARTQCHDRRPRLQALLDAVQLALGRGRAGQAPHGHPTVLLARFAGQWRPVCTWPA